MADFSFAGLNGAVAAGVTTKIQDEQISFDGASLDNIVLNIDGVYGKIGSAVTFIPDQGSSKTDFNLTNVVRERVDLKELAKNKEPRPDMVVFDTLSGLLTIATE
jgi:hypothetical protein